MEGSELPTYYGAGLGLSQIQTKILYCTSKTSTINKIGEQTMYETPMWAKICKEEAGHEKRLYF